MYENLKNADALLDLALYGTESPGAATVGGEMVRIAPADSDHNTDTPYIPDPNPREISNAVMAQNGSVPSSSGNADLFTFFGQFLDHDLDLIAVQHGPDAEQMSFAFSDDPMFDNGGVLSITRSDFTEGENGERVFHNEITGLVDASNIYGSKEEVTEALRADGGKSAYLLTSDDNLLPTIEQIRPQANGLSDEELVESMPGIVPFVGGDVRANENIALTSMHTLWMREHNRRVDELKELHPDWTDDELFDAARLLTTAVWQNVVFNEYVPQLLGEHGMHSYAGFDPDADPSISIEFATAAFRFGHSQVPDKILSINDDGSESSIELSEAFFNPEALKSIGMDSLLRGLAAQAGQEIDAQVIDDVRNLLFAGRPGDLAVLNILRSGDHGIGKLNDVREALGFDRYESFDDITDDTDVQAALQSAYDNDVDAIELWVGGLAEDDIAGSQLGETFHAILSQQFTSLRDGDATYFENLLEGHDDLIAEIKATSLSDVILRNSDIDYLQDDAMIAHTRIEGTRGRDWIRGSDDAELIILGAGHDYVRAKDGGDDVYAGTGNDKVFGELGGDVLFGEDGRDRLYGGDDDDFLDGGDGRDFLSGDAGNDTVEGGADRDTVKGGTGHDVARGGDGRDLVYGGSETILSTAALETIPSMEDPETIGFSAATAMINSGDAAATMCSMARLATTTWLAEGARTCLFSSPAMIGIQLQTIRQRKETTSTCMSTGMSGTKCWLWPVIKEARSYSTSATAIH